MSRTPRPRGHDTIHAVFAETGGHTNTGHDSHRYRTDDITPGAAHA